MKSGKNRKKLVTETEFKRGNSSRELYKKPAKLDVFFILNWIPPLPPLIFITHSSVFLSLVYDSVAR